MRAKSRSGHQMSLSGCSPLTLPFTAARQPRTSRPSRSSAFVAAMAAAGISKSQRNPLLTAMVVRRLQNLSSQRRLIANRLSASSIQLAEPNALTRRAGDDERAWRRTMIRTWPGRSPHVCVGGQRPEPAGWEPLSRRNSLGDSSAPSASVASGVERG